MERAAFKIYLIILILSPLLFGAVYTFAYTIIFLAVLIGSLLLVKKNIKKDTKSGVYKFQLPDTSLNFAFIVLLVFLIFQVIPLPDSLLGFLSPEAMVVGKKSLPASGTLTESPIRQWFALSPYYYPVRMSIIRFTVYGLFFFGLTQMLNSQKRIELTISLILITGCFEALYGLIQTYSGSGYMLWYKKGYNRAVAGTYYDRNHFAGLMEMCLLLAAAYVGALSEKRKRRKMVSGHKTSLRVRISRYLSGEQRFNKRTLILFAGAVIGIGLIFSASRGGMISAAGAMLCMSLFFIFRENHRRKGFVLLLLFLITSVYALQIGVEYPLGRFKYFDIDLMTRTRYARKTIDMFKDYKLAGIGVGNFQYAYPKYQAIEDKKVFLRHAHNDWAQFLAEAGITGFFILIAGISYFMYRTIRLWRKRTDPFAICLGVAPLAVITAMAIHSYSEFNLHVPANCLILTAIMAIGYSALHLERHHGFDKTLYRYHIKPLKYKGMLAIILVLGLIIWTAFWSIRHFMAETYYYAAQKSAPNRSQNSVPEAFKKAIEWDRWNAQYWYKLSRNLVNIRNSEILNLDWNDEYRRIRQMEIIRALKEAVRLNPFAAEYHIRLGWEYAHLCQKPDSFKRWLPAADLSMERAAYFAGDNNPYLHIMIGDYWVMRSKTIHPNNPAWHIYWSKARWHYKKNLSLESGRDRKKMIKYIKRNVRIHYPDEAFIKQVIEQ